MDAAAVADVAEELEHAGEKEARSQDQQQAPPAEANGFQLLMKRGSTTGYMYVHDRGSNRITSRFQARFKATQARPEGLTCNFSTAVEAAVAVARHLQEDDVQQQEAVEVVEEDDDSQPRAASELRVADTIEGQEQGELVTEAEGLQLHMSGYNATGYKHVFPNPREQSNFRAFLKEQGRTVVLGNDFASPVDAAVAVARHLQQQQEQHQQQRWQRQRQREGGEDSGDAAGGENGEEGSSGAASPAGGEALFDPGPLEIQQPTPNSCGRFGCTLSQVHAGLCEFPPQPRGRDRRPAKVYETEPAPAQRVLTATARAATPPRKRPRSAGQQDAVEQEESDGVEEESDGVEEKEGEEEEKVKEKGEEEEEGEEEGEEEEEEEPEEQTEQEETTGKRKRRPSMRVTQGQRQREREEVQEESDETGGEKEVEGEDDEGENQEDDDELVRNELRKSGLVLERSTTTKSGFAGVEYRGKGRKKGLQWCAKAYEQGWREPPTRLGNFNTRSEAALAFAKFTHHGRVGDEGSDAWREKCQSVREYKRKKLGLPTWHRGVPRTKVAAAKQTSSPESPDLPNRQLAAGDEMAERDEPSPPAEPLTSPEAEAADNTSVASGASDLIAAMFV